MITLWLILALILALGVGFGCMVARMLRPTGADPTSTALLEWLTPGRSAVEVYRPMTRLFAEEDFAVLTSLHERGRKLRTRLRRQRVRVLRLYLRELRADFRRIHGLARSLAPASRDPDFAYRITLQALRFHGLCALTEVRCSLGWLAPVRIDASGLLGSLDRVREAARLSLAAVQPQGHAA